MTEIDATSIDGSDARGALTDGGQAGRLGPTSPPQSPPDRVRRWYQAAIAVLLVGIYLAWWFTYAHVHLPPQRYDQLPPGAVATKLGAEFRLVSLTQTTYLVDEYGERESPPADAVWVVARLDVTRRSVNQYWNCAMYLVAEDNRSWEKPFLLSRPTDNCVPDDVPLGQTHPIEVDFQVPVSDADRILGVGLPQNDGGRDPLLTPP